MSLSLSLCLCPCVGVVGRLRRLFPPPLKNTQRRGDLNVTNLQHDGVVVVCEEMDPAAVRAAMAAACADVLGYEQPVEEKPLGEAVSASEDSDMSDGGG